jgi:hypothetical protein
MEAIAEHSDRPHSPAHAEAVNVGTQLDKATSWSQSTAVILGVIGFLWFAGVTIWSLASRFFPTLPISPIILVSVGLGAAWLIRGDFRGAAHSIKGTPGVMSDPAFRLRVIGSKAITTAWAEEPPINEFEPVIVRAWHGVTWERTPPERDASGRIEKQFGGKPTIEPDPARLISMLVLIAVCIGAVHLVRTQLLATGVNTMMFEAWCGAGIALAVSGWIFPVYIRTAPGVLDVFQFGPLGLGTPQVARYNLRTAGVVVATGGSVRVQDESRPSGKVVFIDSRGVLGDRPAFARAVLDAARSSASTPALPMDALT